MSTETETIVDTDVDLDTFAADFFSPKEAQPEPANSEEADEDTDDSDADAPNEDTHTDGDDTSADTEDEDSDEEDEEEEAPEPAPAPKKKNRFQERIDEVVGKQRETERQLAAALKRIEDFEKSKPTEPEPVKAVAQENTGPAVTDQNEDGTDKYPLGEFDPGYIRDLTRFTLHQEREAMKAQEAAEASQRESDAQRAAMQTEWNERLVPARERYPDFQEKGEALIASFDGLDQNYGEYLTTVIMGIEHGPDVLYYLANNPDEAQKIVGSGYTKATLALGVLNAKFADAEQEKQSARPKVSKAPTPPPHVNKGSAVTKPEIADDEEDLDLFEKKFYNKRKRA